MADVLCGPQSVHGLELNTWLPFSEIQVYKANLIKPDKAARGIMAEQSGKKGAKGSHWRVIAKPGQDTWYDWVDVPNAKVGQCMIKADGTWHQEPLGEAPVLLAYKGPKKKKETT